MSDPDVPAAEVPAAEAAFAEQRDPRASLTAGPFVPLAGVVLVLVGALALREVATIVVPVVFGLFLALVAWPLVGTLERRGVRHALALAAALLLVLVVVLVAIPFGAASGRRNVYVGVAASILIFFTYYIVQQMGFTFGETGRVAPWLGAWLPNLFFAVGSLWMISRVR